LNYQSKFKRVYNQIRTDDVSYVRVPQTRGFDH
jgi:hypothetical protein